MMVNWSVIRLLLITIIMMQVPLFSETAMSKSDEDMSMLLARARHVETISSDIAIKLAEMIFRRSYGSKTTDGQLPLIAHDQGDRWEVEGSNNVPSSIDLSDPLGGKLVIIIMKTDCRIVKLARILVPDCTETVIG